MIPPDLQDFWNKYELSFEKLIELIRAAKEVEEKETEQVLAALEWENYERTNSPGYNQGLEPLSLKEFVEEYYSFAPGSLDEEAAYGFLRLIRG